MSYGKALSNMMKSDAFYDVTIICSLDGDGNNCDFYADHEQCLTKMKVARDARADGWTFDKAGNWLCPAHRK